MQNAPGTQESLPIETDRNSQLGKNRRSREVVSASPTISPRGSHGGARAEI